MSLDFTGKTVIVTGSGGGLGRSHALEFARRGANVVVNDLGGSVDGSGGSSEAADAVVKTIIDNGGKAISNGASVTDDKGVANMVEQTLSEFGRIDVLVNNAGVLRDKSFSNMSMSDFEFVVDVHLMGTVKTTHAVFPIMKEQNYGRIVVTTSSSGLYGNFGQSNYGAGKMGVVGMMNTLELEGAKYNIHVNALAPVAWTRMTEDLMPPEAEALLTPESVTPAVVFMSSDQAPSGQIICAGAGVFAAAQVVETPGKLLGVDAAAEDVAANWEEISDLTEAKPLGMGFEQSAKFFALHNLKR
ncbi:MAG: SDR family NAD(P)-dependent oxidoreductase [Pseudomonadota bacterium]|nr:SDR family NAD(P)-dependent oxidoreductase [Pseudomonadota bacterium]